MLVRPVKQVITTKPTLEGPCICAAHLGQPVGSTNPVFSRAIGGVPQWLWRGTAGASRADLAAEHHGSGCGVGRGCWSEPGSVALSQPRS
jgi:hypothetical protein